MPFLQPAFTSSLPIPFLPPSHHPLLSRHSTRFPIFPPTFSPPSKSSSYTPTLSLPSPPTSTPSSSNPPRFFALPAAFLSSAIGSLIGAGGGIILTPLLSLLSIPQHTCHGTSLATISITALISSFRYSKSAAANFPTAILLSLPALITAPFGARASSSINATNLRSLFARFLIFVSFLIFLRPYIPTLDLGVISPWLKWPLLALLGGVSGFLSGLLGIGGGTLNVPALILLAGFSQRVAQGTALMAMVLPSMRGAWTHLQLGQVQVALLPALVVGAVFGGFVGASVAVGMNEGVLRVVCSGVFAMMGLRYLSSGKKKLDTVKHE